jgi:hypothetical protein
MTLSPEFTSSSGTFIGGELYISKVVQSRPQVSEIGIFPQFSGHYVRLECTLFEQPCSCAIGAGVSSEIRSGSLKCDAT